MIWILILLGVIGEIIGFGFFQMYITSFVPKGAGVWLVRGFMTMFVSSIVVVVGASL